MAPETSGATVKAEMALADVGEQTAGGRFHHVVNSLETRSTAVVGIGYLFGAPVRGESHEQAQLVGMGWRAQALQDLEIVLIHGEDIVEPLEIVHDHTTCAQVRHVDTTPDSRHL